MSVYGAPTHHLRRDGNVMAVFEKSACEIVGGTCKTASGRKDDDDR